jgi:hypothetical protein
MSIEMVYIVETLVAHIHKKKYKEATVLLSKTQVRAWSGRKSRGTCLERYKSGSRSEF